MYNLLNNEKSIASLVSNNTSRINSCTTKNELVDTMRNLFSESKIDTPATRRLILNMSNKKSLAGALQVVYNSMLAGSNLAVARVNKEV